MSRVPVHVVAGYLGTGKTTTLRRLLATRGERCAVVVNDFGEAAVDATLLSDGTAVTNIPGGCVCCTAPEGLAAALSTILDELRPDRVFVEPSGLARPRDVVDMLSRGPIAARIELRPTIVLVDPARDDGPAALSAEQLGAADVLVANRCDLASPEQLATFRARAASAWPPPMLVVETSHGVLPPAALEWSAGEGPRAAEALDDHHHHHHDHAPSTAGHLATSAVFPPQRTFAWDALQRLVGSTAGLVRFKGLFHTDLGWFRLDRVGDTLHAEPAAWRRDSRYDAIFAGGDPDAFAAGLRAAVPAAVADGDTLRLEGPDGRAVDLDRARLAALGEPVADVGALVPGRRGTGTWLRDVLALLGPDPGARFVVVANDGLTTEPTPVAGAGEAVLVHSLDGAPLPAREGGPFRILGPTGEGRTACANVKGVARLRLLPPST